MNGEEFLKTWNPEIIKEKYYKHAAIKCMYVFMCVTVFTLITYTN